MVKLPLHILGAAVILQALMTLAIAQSPSSLSGRLVDQPISAAQGYINYFDISDGRTLSSLPSFFLQKRNFVTDYKVLFYVDFSKTGAGFFLSSFTGDGTLGETHRLGPLPSPCSLDPDFITPSANLWSYESESTGQVYFACFDSFERTNKIFSATMEAPEQAEFILAGVDPIQPYAFSNFLLFSLGGVVSFINFTAGPYVIPGPPDLSQPRWFWTCGNVLYVVLGDGSFKGTKDLIEWVDMVQINSYLAQSGVYQPDGDICFGIDEQYRILNISGSTPSITFLADPQDVGGRSSNEFPWQSSLLALSFTNDSVFALQYDGGTSNNLYQLYSGSTVLVNTFTNSDEPLSFVMLLNNHILFTTMNGVWFSQPGTWPNPAAEDHTPVEGGLFTILVDTLFCDQDADYCHVYVARIQSDMIQGKTRGHTLYLFTISGSSVNQTPLNKQTRKPDRRPLVYLLPHRKQSDAVVWVGAVYDPVVSHEPHFWIKPAGEISPEHFNLVEDIHSQLPGLGNDIDTLAPRSFVYAPDTSHLASYRSIDDIRFAVSGDPRGVDAVDPSIFWLNMASPEALPLILPLCDASSCASPETYHSITTDSTGSTTLFASFQLFQLSPTGGIAHSERMDVAPYLATSPDGMQGVHCAGQFFFKMQSTPALIYCRPNVADSAIENVIATGSYVSQPMLCVADSYIVFAALSGANSSIYAWDGITSVPHEIGSLSTSSYDGCSLAPLSYIGAVGRLLVNCRANDSQHYFDLWPVTDTYPPTPVNSTLISPTSSATIPHVSSTHVYRSDLNGTQVRFQRAVVAGYNGAFSGYFDREINGRFQYTYIANRGIVGFVGNGLYYWPDISTSLVGQLIYIENAMAVDRVIGHDRFVVFHSTIPGPSHKTTLVDLDGVQDPVVITDMELAPGDDLSDNFDRVELMTTFDLNGFLGFYCYYPPLGYQFCHLTDKVPSAPVSPPAAVPVAPPFTVAPPIAPPVSNVPIVLPPVIQGDLTLNVTNTTTYILPPGAVVNGTITLQPNVVLIIDNNTTVSGSVLTTNQSTVTLSGTVAITGGLESNGTVVISPNAVVTVGENVTLSSGSTIQVGGGSTVQVNGGASFGAVTVDISGAGTGPLFVINGTISGSPHIVIQDGGFIGDALAQNGEYKLLFASSDSLTSGGNNFGFSLALSDNAQLRECETVTTQSEVSGTQLSALFQVDDSRCDEVGFEGWKIALIVVAAGLFIGGVITTAVLLHKRAQRRKEVESVKQKLDSL